MNISLYWTQYSYFVLNPIQNYMNLPPLSPNCTNTCTDVTRNPHRTSLHYAAGDQRRQTCPQDLQEPAGRQETATEQGAFDNQAEEIHLVTFCVTELNDTMDNGIHLPIIYGLAVNVKTGEIFKAKFQDHQPDEDLRLAYTLTGGHMVNIYDAKTEQLNIGPYSWTPLPNIDFWLEQEDQQILQIPDLNTRTLACRIPHYQYLSDLACNKPSTFVPQIHSFSTSPEAEPSHFVKEVRSALQFLKKHPYPSISLFPAGKPRSYKKKDDGEWQRM
ncbi:protein N-terminal asparagine amidohydrolase isoform X5 [Pyxicephalus adspersus]|uniref:protein N-terminal asparagine amidohydrolase isoform X5 n=1 Tax=Pyxicephalus adspersus TaxID=30357 RepID=UPI003B5B63A8